MRRARWGISGADVGEGEGEGTVIPLQARRGLNVEVQQKTAYHVEVVILGGVALRWLWKDDAVAAVVEFLENTSRASAEMARAM